MYTRKHTFESMLQTTNCNLTVEQIEKEICVDLEINKDKRAIQIWKKKKKEKENTAENNNGDNVVLLHEPTVQLHLEH